MKFVTRYRAKLCVCIQSLNNALYCITQHNHWRPELPPFFGLYHQPDKRNEELWRVVFAKKQGTRRKQRQTSHRPNCINVCIGDTVEKGPHRESHQAKTPKTAISTRNRYRGREVLSLQFNPHVSTLSFIVMIIINIVGCLSPFNFCFPPFFFLFHEIITRGGNCSAKNIRDRLIYLADLFFFFFLYLCWIYIRCYALLSPFFSISLSNSETNSRHTGELMISKNNKCVSSSRLDAHQSDALLR